MLHLPISKSHYQSSSEGFTIIELMVVIGIVGILCAIAAPSLLAMQGTAKLNTSLDILRTAIETTQFQAIQKKNDAAGNTCRIYIPTTAPTNNKIIGNCLVSASGSSSGVSDTSTEGATLAGTSGGAGSLNGWATVSLDDGITVDTAATTLAGTPPKIIYNYKGITLQGGTIVLKSSDSGDKRCLIVNAGAGLLRSGSYASGTCTLAE